MDEAIKVALDYARMHFLAARSRLLDKQYREADMRIALALSQVAKAVEAASGGGVSDG
jgi:hypothetical protein